jgi:peptidylprolyl isomerase
VKKSLIVLLVLPILALSACSGSSSSGSSSSGSSGESVQAGAGKTTDCAVQGAPVPVASIPEGPTLDGVTVIADGAKAPLVTVADGAAPVTELGTLEIAAGDGATAKAGDTLTVEYCGIGLASQSIFDSWWVRGEPATLPLDGLIQGWQDGLPGMKVGETRLLVIPGVLGYGPNPPSGSGIEPDETLVFVITLKDVVAS